MFIEDRKTGFAVLLEYSLYGFFAIFPFFIFNSFLYQGSSSRFLLLTLFSSVLAIGLGAHLFYEKNRVHIMVSPVLIIAALYLVILFVAAGVGVDFGASFWSRAERTSGLFYLSHLAVMILFFIHMVYHLKTRERLLKVVLFSSALYSFCTLLGPQGFDVLFRKNPYDGFMFGNSSFAAMYLLGAFLLSLYFAFIKREKSAWFWYVVPLLIAFNPFFINLTRPIDSISSILGIAKASSVAFFVSLAMMLMFYLFRKIKKEKVRNVVLVCFMTVSIFGLAFSIQSLLNKNGLVHKAYEQNSTLARPLVWSIAKESVRQRPIFGWGGDNFPEAFQKNFDIRLLEEAYGNEPWFDRAHNVILDQAVDTGYVGILIYIVLFLTVLSCMGYVIVQAKKKEDVFLGVLLFVYFYVHMLELQTAFDTTISYVMLGLMFSLVVYLFYKVRTENGHGSSVMLSGGLRYVVAVVLLGWFTWALLFGVLPFWKVQRINGEIRAVGSAEKRIDLYDDLFKTNVDRAGVLWRTSVDFQKGVADNPSILENPEKKAYLLEELGIITAGYEDYTSLYPDKFRPYLNLADMYIYHMLFGVNMLNEADVVLDKAIALSGRHPQPYWMKAVVSLYRRDFVNARKYVDQAKIMDPEVVETKRLERYISDSIKTFPEISLYFFNQI